MRIFTTILIQCFFLTILNCQTLIHHTTGNGYNFENAIASQALNCISNGCFSELKRSKFIDETTINNLEDVNQYVDSLSYLLDLKYQLRPRPIIQSPHLSPLTFIRTFKFKSSDSIYLQIQLELEYQNGYLKAKDIEFIEKEFLNIEDTLWHKYNEKTGSKTNIPLPPPTPRINEILEVPFGINLCSGCWHKKLITVDNARNFWLNEKHKYENLQLLDYNKILAKKENLYGVVTRENKVIVPIEYDELIVKAELGFEVKKNQLFGVFDYSGKEIIPVEYDEIKTRLYYNSKSEVQLIFIVQKDGLYGVLNRKGNLLLPLEYDELYLFHSKYFRAKKFGKFGIISLDKGLILDFIYERIDLENLNIKVIGTVAKNEKDESLLILDNDELKIVKKLKYKK